MFLGVSDLWQAAFVTQREELLLPSSFYIAVRPLQTLFVLSSLLWPWSFCHLLMTLARFADGTYKEGRGEVQGIEETDSAPLVTSFVFQWMRMPLWLGTWQLVIVVWVTVLPCSLFGMAVGGLCVWFNGILFCFSQAQITVNGNSGTAASPVSHFQRPFSPSSVYPPPASLNSNIVIMQHGRMMGKPHTEYLLYTLHNIFQFMW